METLSETKLKEIKELLRTLLNDEHVKGWKKKKDHLWVHKDGGIVFQYDGPPQEISYESQFRTLYSIRYSPDGSNHNDLYLYKLFTNRDFYSCTIITSEEWEKIKSDFKSKYPSCYMQGCITASSSIDTGPIFSGGYNNIIERGSGQFK